MSGVENQGLKVYNDNSQLCIDSNYSNLELKRVIKFGDLPVRERTSAEVLRYLTLNDGEVLVAREINNSPINIGSGKYNAVNIANCSYANEAETYLYGVGIGAGAWSGISNPESYANNLKLYVFGTPDQTEASGRYGLKVYDKNGIIVYDSNKKYMRVVGVGTESGANYSLSGKKYAVVEASQWLPEYKNSLDCMFYTRVDEVYKSDTVITLSTENAFSPIYADIVFNTMPLLSGCFILDVTNY